jgi:signal transduction histidine kinase
MTIAFDYLRRLNGVWSNLVLEILERDPVQRKVDLAVLERFFLSLNDVLLTNDWHPFETFVDQWLQSMRFGQEKVDFDAYVDLSLVSLLHTFQGAMFTTARTELEDAETLELLQQLEPIFFRMVMYAAYRESRLQLDLASEKQQKLNQALDNLNESRSRFITVATQELRTPLTLIEGYMELLREQIDQGSALNSWLDGMAGGAAKMRDLIDDLIDVAMIDNQMVSLQYKAVKIRELLESVRQEVQPKLKSRSLSLRIYRVPEFDEPIFIDSDRTQQAIMHVVDNALRYTRKNGTVTIRGRELSGFLEITIKDMGPGIDPKDQTKIFDPFSSLLSDGTSRDAEARPRLGLHLARGILEAHGGAIWVSSSGFDDRKHPGSTFHLMIPFNKVPPDDLTARLLGLHRSDIQ